jgi:hypothetical protein
MPGPSRSGSATIAVARIAGGEREAGKQYALLDLEVTLAVLLPEGLEVIDRGGGARLVGPLQEECGVERLVVVAREWLKLSAPLHVPSTSRA